jgi:hypothetical protein
MRKVSEDARRVGSDVKAPKIIWEVEILAQKSVSVDATVTARAFGRMPRPASRGCLGFSIHSMYQCSVNSTLHA